MFLANVILGPAHADVQDHNFRAARTISNRREQGGWVCKSVLTLVQVREELKDRMFSAYALVWARSERPDCIVWSRNLSAQPFTIPYVFIDMHM